MNLTEKRNKSVSAQWHHFLLGLKMLTSTLLCGTFGQSSTVTTRALRFFRFDLECIKLIRIQTSVRGVTIDFKPCELRMLSSSMMDGFHYLTGCHSHSSTKLSHKKQQEQYHLVISNCSVSTVGLFQSADGKAQKIQFRINTPSVGVLRTHTKDCRPFTKMGQKSNVI